jgi:hypothetical protein
LGQTERHPVSIFARAATADGAFAWQPGTGSNLLTTAQAVAALLGQTYPFVVQPLESCADRRTRSMGKETISAQP